MNGTPLRTIPDTWLMVHAPNTYFRTFVKTVAFKNKSLRPQVADHIRMGEPLTYTSMVLAFLEVYCSERDIQVCVSSDSVPGIPRFASLMQHVLFQYGYPLEVEIWKELLNKGSHGLK